MLLVNDIAGNIFTSKHLGEKSRQARLADQTERLIVSRSEMERQRLRRRTDRGTDIGIVLERENRLHHGDVLELKEKFIVVEQKPEKVASVIVEERSKVEMVDMAALIGHIIGNRHRPISIRQGKISFPVQNDSEIEVFEKLLPAGVRLEFSMQVFVPSRDVHHHE